jgi:hypothetical protein
MTQHRDLMVEEYLAAVASAGPDLPPHRRDDLLADLREHIASARADLTPETEAGVRTILARLGDPASIVAEARLGITPPPVPPLPLAGSVPVSGRRGIPGWVTALMVAGVVVFLTCVGVIFVGFVAFNPGPMDGPGPACDRDQSRCRREGPVPVPTYFEVPSRSPGGLGPS